MLTNQAEIRAAIAWNRALAETDKTLLLRILEAQSSGDTITHAQLSDGLGILPESVARRLRKLRNRGLISSRRVGAFAWTYDLTGVSGQRPGVNLNKPEEIPRDTRPPCPYGCPCKCPYTPREIFNSDFNSDSNLTNTTGGGGCSPLLSQEKDESEYSEKPKSDSSEQEENVGAISGPSGPLMELLEQQIPAVSSSESEKSAPPAVRKQLRLGLPGQPRRRPYSAPAVRLARFKAKDPEDYTVPDLELHFRTQWEEAGLPGRPFSWTNKDRAQMKSLLNDQGPAEVAEYLTYVLNHWDDLKRRYKVRGMPSPSVIFGFRRSWFSESIEPPKEEIPVGPAEWSGKKIVGW